MTVENVPESTGYHWDIQYWQTGRAEPEMESINTTALYWTLAWWVYQRVFLPVISLWCQYWTPSRRRGFPPSTHERIYHFIVQVNTAACSVFIRWINPLLCDDSHDTHKSDVYIGLKNCLLLTAYGERIEKINTIFPGLCSIGICIGLCDML